MMQQRAAQKQASSKGAGKVKDRSLKKERKALTLRSAVQQRAARGGGDAVTACQYSYVCTSKSSKLTLRSALQQVEEASDSFTANESSKTVKP